MLLRIRNHQDIISFRNILIHGYDAIDDRIVWGVIDEDLDNLIQEVGMRFVSVRDLRGKSAEVWKDLPGEGEMIITSNGRPVAILSAVNESNQVT